MKTISELQAAAAPRASAKDWTALAVLALPCLVYAMDLTVLNLAVPQLSLALQPSPSQLLWIIDIYGFMVAGTLVLMGTLGDRIGRRRLLLIGAGAFAAASAVAGMARTAEELIAARALLGIAGATLAPSTLSLIRNIFLNERERTFAIGVWIACFSSGAALGPLVGGVILTWFSWSMVFFAAIPAMLLLLILGPLLLPEFRDEAAGRLDVISAVQSIAASLALIYGMKRAAEAGIDARALAGVAFGLVIGAFFIARQRRLADPMLDLTLFRDPAIGAALSINVTAMLGAMGIFVFISQYLQLVRDMSPMEAGFWTAPGGICFAIGSLLTPALVRRWSPVNVLTGALMVAIGGFLLLTQLEAHSPLALLMVAMVLLCLGLSPVGTLTTDLVMTAAPPERAGAASAISETSCEFGGALGIAILGSLVAATYRFAMADFDGADIAPDALAASRGSLDAAVTAARGLPLAPASRLLDAAHQAFSTAFDRAALACAAATFAALLIARFRLRRI